ncbi:MAG: hypothetical protein EA385_11560 [Salinarimonadaceae bacterium]|nr:MAG: hypothetical protein EA385_11560 [Salinarimonadaceae bacterium]
MSKSHKVSLRSIVAASVAAPLDFEERNHPRIAAVETPPQPRTLKQRAKQMSVYLEPPVYDQLRDIAHAERTKIHPLMLEALDMFFRHRGARSIRQLMADDGR